MISATDFSTAVNLDIADGVLDGRFYGTQIGLSAPVYRTPTFETSSAFSSLGLLGATSALTLGSYPTAPTFSLPLPSATSLYPEVVSQVASYPVVPSSTCYACTPSVSSIYPSFSRPVYPSVVPSATIQYPTVSTTQVVESYVLPPPTPTIEYCCVPAPQVQIQYVQAPPEVRYIQSPPEIRYVQSPPEIRYIEAPVKAPEPVVEDPRIAEFAQAELRYQEEITGLRAQLAHMKALEERLSMAELRNRALMEEIEMLRTKLLAKQELRSQTNVTETYKVKSFEMAAKLAVMDGTDDGMYNGLPIEVEGEGLYRELVAQGRKPRADASLTGRQSSITTSKETYKVKSFEMAEKLSKMDGTDDGLYNGLPIEVVGEGLFRELRAGGRTSTVTTTVNSTGGAVLSTSSQSNYKVNTYEMAEKLSKMDGQDNGLYNGLPIEVAGQGLFRDLRAQRANVPHP